MGSLDAALQGVADALDSWLADGDRVVITRPSGADPVLNETTGDLTTAPEHVVYDGVGFVQPASSGSGAQSDPRAAAIIRRTGAQFQVVLPIGNGELAHLGDTLVVAAQSAADAPPSAHLEGVRYKVVSDEVPASAQVCRLLYLKVDQ